MITLLTQDQASLLRDVRLMSLQTDPGAYVSTVDYESNFPIDHFVQKIRYKTLAPTFGYHGLFEQEKLVGYVLLDKSTYPKTSHLAYIYELYIKPGFRRHGRARKLVQRVIDLARNTNQTEMLMLHVVADNQKGIDLYTSLGFEITAELPRTIKSDHIYKNELVLMLELISKPPHGCDTLVVG